MLANTVVCSADGSSFPTAAEACAAISGTKIRYYSLGGGDAYTTTTVSSIDYERRECSGTIKYSYSPGVLFWNYGSVGCRCDTGSDSTSFYISLKPSEQGACKVTSPTLTLTTIPNQTPPDPHPKGTEGKDPKSSTHELIAKVNEGRQPKAGVAVTFKVDVIEKTGGHGHHDANRPKGSVPASGVTDANGEIKLTFQASEVAGSHNITATCDSCSNKTAVKKVDVLVPDLIPISPNPPQNADGSYKYAFTAVDPGHIGTSGGRQRGEYYLTTEALVNLESLVREFTTQGWGTIAFNDASLNWGGVYDINNNWRPPHSTHRKGEDIDISFTRARNPISKKKQSEFYDKFCEDKKVSIPFTILHHYQAIPHFHVYLMGQKQCAKTPN